MDPERLTALPSRAAGRNRATAAPAERALGSTGPAGSGRRVRRHHGGPGPVTGAGCLTPTACGSPPTTGGTTTGGTGSSSCKVTLTPQTWSGGYTADVTVANTGSALVDGWKLGFTLPSGQAITGAWNAGISPSSGSVTATNLSYNAQIPPGGSQPFGFQGTDTGSYGPPTAFTLNGTACAS